VKIPDPSSHNFPEQEKDHFRPFGKVAFLHPAVAEEFSSGADLVFGIIPKPGEISI
jgi:hypothetical protein